MWVVNGLINLTCIAQWLCSVKW